MHPARSLVVIDAPTNLGLRPPAPGRLPGVYRMPDALRRHGFVERIGAKEGGRIVPAPYSPEWYPGFGVRNADAIRAFTLELANRIGVTIDGGDFPIVLGGDCSVLLGAMLDLRRRGRYGLVYIDGHCDFRHPGNAPAVEAVAGEDLAIVTGRGDDLLTDIDGLRPYVLDAKVIALGDREGDDEYDDIRDTAITLWDLDHLRRIGIAESARKTVNAMQRGEVDGYWIHLDVDVLDSEIMPAVDSPQPDGLSYAELADLVTPILNSGLAVGLELTIFDPDLDPSGSIAAGLVDALVDILST